MTELTLTNKKCPSITEIKCVEKCAQWFMDLKLTSKSYSISQKVNSNAVCTRNFKESLCKLLMSSNNNENALDFAALKETYGKPFFSDIENLKPNLPIDQTNVNISSLGPEFFTFFVEVDLKQQEGDCSKGLRRITPEFDMFEYEVFINANIHNTKLLDKDFHVKLDTFKILKSIQFRIESYKSYLKGRKSMKRELFVKILEEDINMGIIFSLPKQDPIESFYSNIHNLLNSNIKINKIYFEIILPQSLFFRTQNNNHPQQFIFSNNIILNHLNQQKLNSSVRKSSDNDIKPNLNDLIENNKKLLENLKNSRISPRIKNEMSQIISQQLSGSSKYLPNFGVSNSNIPLNANVGINNYNNPNTINMPSNLFNRNRNVKSNIFNRDLKVSTSVNNNPKNTEIVGSNTSSQESSSLLQQNSVLSFNKFDVANKLKQQNITSTPINEPDVYSNIKANNNNIPKNTVFPKNKFEFPSKPKHLSCDFTNNNKSINTNPFTQTIPFQQQNNPYNNPLNQFINSQLNFDSQSFNNKLKKNFQIFSQNQRTNSKKNILHSINTENSSNTNICNWQIFMTNATPLVQDTEDTPVKFFFEAFEKASILGLDCILKNSNTSILTNYDLTISSLHIELSGNNDSFGNFNSTQYSSNSSKKPEGNFVKEESNSSFNPPRINSTLTPPISRVHTRTPSDFNLNNTSNNALEHSFFSTSSIESFVSNEEVTMINEKKHRRSSKLSSTCLNFSEDQPLHNRQNFKAKIDEIFKMYPEYENLLLGEISENSYFSILYTPVKSTNNFNNQASFLVYYRFRGKSFSNSLKYLSVIGMISNKIDEEFWLTNQHLNYNPKYMNDFLYNKIIEDFFKNKYRYIQVNDFCHKFVFNNKIAYNIDYNFFIKY